MGLDVAKLLLPLSPEAPCGEDLRYDRRALEVLRLGEGKPEQVMGDQTIAGEDPDWREVRDGCLELLGRSKDLRIALWLSLSSLRMDGLPGFRDGLLVLKGYLEQFWAEVHPKLDPDDNNDPTERANILSSLNTPYKSFGDVMKFHERIMEAPLAESRALGRFGLKDIMIASGTLTADAGVVGTPATTSVIDGAFEETDLDRLEVIASAAGEIADLAKGIDDLFTSLAGANNAPEMEKFITLTRDVHTQVKRRLDKRKGVATEGESADGAGAAAVPGSGGGGAAFKMDGDLGNREQVKQIFQKVYNYYERVEPSSPVPLIMKCCEKMVGRKFVDIWKLLTPEAVALLEKLAAEEEPPATS